MRILHSFLAIGGGFLAIAVLVAVTTTVLARVAPERVNAHSQPRRLHLLLNLGYSAVFAAVGGYITASIARENPLVHTLALALVVLLLSALSALQLKGTLPVIYQLLLTAFTPLAVLAGGMLRLKQLGLL